MKKIFSLPIHPLLFALYPLLFFYSRNAWLFSVGELFEAAGIVLTVTGGLIILFGLVLKGNFARAGLIISLGAIMFFSLGLAAGLWSPRLLLSLSGALFLIGAIFIFLKGGNLKRFTYILNFVALFLVVLPLFDIGKNVYDVKNNNKREGVSVSEVGSAAYKPDIYFILPDGYAHSSTLEKRYEYDNSAFYEELRQRGFQVVDKSRANYSYTLLSVVSAFNMAYIFGPDGKPLENSGEEGLVMKMWSRLVQDFRNNKVLQILDELGYRYIQITSGGWTPVMENKNADVLFMKDPSNILPTKNALLWAFLKEYSAVRFLASRLTPILFGEGESVLYAFEKIREAPDMFPGEPKFIYAHILSPHIQYTLDRDCNVIPYDKPELYGTYVDKLICTNKQILETVDEVLAKSKRPPIIIVMSDHGWGRDNKTYRVPIDLVKDKDDIPTEQYKFALRNFMALYFPDHAESVPQQLTPVNLWRLVFNTYFGGNFQFLEDKSYFMVSESNARIFDVTDEVKF